MMPRMLPREYVAISLEKWLRKSNIAHWKVRIPVKLNIYYGASTLLKLQMILRDQNITLSNVQNMNKLTIGRISLVLTVEALLVNITTILDVHCSSSIA